VSELSVISGLLYTIHVDECLLRWMSIYVNIEIKESDDIVLIYFYDNMISIKFKEGGGRQLSQNIIDSILIAIPWVQIVIHVFATA